MKLIIDITDERIDECQYTLSSPFRVAPVIESYCAMIANGIPLEEELEKVKEKIRNRKDGWGKYPCCDCCIDIIDAEISELKGETHVES